MNTQEFTLRAMAENYKNGHSWDHLDGEACIAAADEIKMLRSLLPPALPSFSNEAAPASAEPVAWVFFDRKGYENFLRTGDRGFISDISVVKDFLEQKSRSHEVTLPLYSGLPLNLAPLNK